MNKFQRLHIIYGAVTLLAAMTPAAQAHHSTAQFDMARRVTFVGTVKKFDYQNPHAWIWLEVPQSDGGSKEIGIECGSPAMLRGNGLAWNSLKKGEKVTVVAGPFKDDKMSGGILVSITWPDGRKWGGKGPFAEAAPAPDGPSGGPAPGAR